MGTERNDTPLDHVIIKRKSSPQATGRVFISSQESITLHGEARPRPMNPLKHPRSEEGE
jgi:hypothetical protein